MSKAWCTKERGAVTTEQLPLLIRLGAKAAGCGVSCLGLMDLCVLGVFVLRLAEFFTPSEPFSRDPVPITAKSSSGDRYPGAPLRSRATRDSEGRGAQQAAEPRFFQTFRAERQRPWS